MSVRHLATALLVASLTAGCGLLAERRAAAALDERLEAAGFRRVPADTAAKREHLARMPERLFTTTTTKRGERRYLLADPDRCGCLYVGDEAAYQRYTNLELAQEETASAAAARRDDRNAGVNDLPPEIDAFAVDIELDTKGAN
jgi:hypothetical protein